MAIIPSSSGLNDPSSPRIVRMVGRILPAGLARWTSSYSGAVSGTVKDSTGQPMQRTMRAYDRASGELLSSGASNPSTGAYTLSVPKGNEVDVLCLDDVAGTLENDLVHRTIPT